MTKDLKRYFKGIQLSNKYIKSWSTYMSLEEFKLKQQLDTTTKLLGTSQVMLVVKNLPANAGDTRDEHQIPGLERSPGGEHGNPFQYSCLENPLDRGPPFTLQSTGCKESYMTEVTQYACINTHTTIRVAKSRMLKTPNATEDMEQQEFSSIPGGNTKWYSHFGKYFGSILQS